MKRSWLTGEPWEDTSPMRGHDGQYRWYLSRSVPMRDSHGKIVRWFGTSTDVTEHKQMEEMLRERAELLDLASEAVMVRDSAGILQFWNVGAETLYGWTRKEVIGKNVHEILKTTYPIATREIDSQAGNHGQVGRKSCSAHQGRP